MKKTAVCAIFLCCVFAPFLPAQQLTRFAVVDLPRVYVAFFRDSRAVRDFEERSAQVQNDVDRMTREINDLKNRQINAEFQGDQQQSMRL
ncbi:MAG: OmpH family outer membrane protein, partial [Treponema sp.]|nr:OmpH family outer membrane protein [Treponema sp.]